MSIENKLIKYVKESVFLVGGSVVIGLIVKKVLKKNLINDPSSSLMNAAEWTLVMAGSIYGRDYLIDQKIIPQ